MAMHMFDLCFVVMVTSKQIFFNQNCIIKDCINATQTFIVFSSSTLLNVALPHFIVSHGGNKVNCLTCGNNVRKQTTQN